MSEAGLPVFEAFFDDDTLNADTLERLRKAHPEELRRTLSEHLDEVQVEAILERIARILERAAAGDGSIATSLRSARPRS